jgi:hypothetical protein
MSYEGPHPLPARSGGTGLPAPGTSGNVLTSTGTTWASSPPSGGGSTSFTGDSGTASGAIVNISAGQSSRNCGATVSLNGNNASSMLFDVTDVQGNTFLGRNAGNAGLGGDSNTSLGDSSLTNVGSVAFRNTAIGCSSLLNLVNGSDNIALGNLAGSAHTTNDSGNINIGSTGVAAQANTTRIGYIGGTASTQQLCFLDGVTGVSVTGSPVIVDANGQLGVTVSSIIFKDNIEHIRGRSESIYKLIPRSFTYKTDGSKHFGLIAQEVEEVMPELVTYARNEPFSVKYDQIPILMLNELQKLKQEVVYLKSLISNQSK